MRTPWLALLAVLMIGCPDRPIDKNPPTQNGVMVKKIPISADIDISVRDRQLAVDARQADRRAAAGPADQRQPAAEGSAGSGAETSRNAGDTRAQRGPASVTGCPAPVATLCSPATAFVSVRFR